MDHRYISEGIPICIFLEHYPIPIFELDYYRVITTSFTFTVIQEKDNVWLYTYGIFYYVYCNDRYSSIFKNRP